MGLGVGTLATYARPGDNFRFYEINPEVLRLANAHFTYLRDCEGACDVVMGDSRVSLERDEPQAFDVLVLDAFSGDSIPTHLLTKEAFRVYLKHLNDDGILAVHITNRYLNLAPVVRRLAAESGLKTTRIFQDGNRELLTHHIRLDVADAGRAFLICEPGHPLTRFRPQRVARTALDGQLQQLVPDPLEPLRCLDRQIFKNVSLAVDCGGAADGRGRHAAGRSWPSRSKRTKNNGRGRRPDSGRSRNALENA